MPGNIDLSEKTAELLSKVVLNPLIRDSFVEALKTYFRLTTVGIENIPKEGPALIIPNHSGFAGLDAIILSHEIAKRTGRTPNVMTHFFWFLSPATGIPIKKLGFVPATHENGAKLLKENHLITLFPEGENGNFKPSNRKYQLQEFKRGFVRLALQCQSPIIPTLIIGAEESQVNLTQFQIPFFIKKLLLPLPLNLIPLPSRWKLVFLPPIHLPYQPIAATNNDLVHEITFDIQEKMQIALTNEVQSRKSIYL